MSPAPHAAFSGPLSTAVQSGLFGGPDPTEQCTPTQRASPSPGGLPATGGGQGSALKALLAQGPCRRGQALERRRHTRHPEHLLNGGLAPLTAMWRLTGLFQPPSHIDGLSLPSTAGPTPSPLAGASALLRRNCLEWPRPPAAPCPQPCQLAPLSTPALAEPHPAQAPGPAPPQAACAHLGGLTLSTSANVTTTLELAPWQTRLGLATCPAHGRRPSTAQLVCPGTAVPPRLT